MTISDKIVASYVEGFSGVYIYCPKEKMDEVASTFEEDFEEAWNTAMDDAEEEYDAVCYEKEEDIGVPASVQKEEDRIVVKLEPLSMAMNDGARSDNDYGPDALKDTLAGLKQKYPEISYEGIIAYEWSDEHGGDVVNFEISSENTVGDKAKTYDFVGETLHMVLDDDMFAEEFWEKMQMFMEDAEEEDFIKVATDFHLYGLDDCIDQLLEIADEVDDEIRESVEELVDSWQE